MNRPLLHFIRGVGEKMPYVRRKTHASLWRQRVPSAHRCTDRWATSPPPARALIPAGGPESQRQRCHSGKTDWRDVCKVKHLKPLKVQHFIEQETAVCFLRTKIFAGCSHERHHSCIHLLYSTGLILIQKILQALILIRDNKVQWR